MKTGIELIAEERQRQIDQEGYDAHHDSIYTTELFLAGCCYYAAERERVLGDGTNPVPTSWPWSPEFWKPTPSNRVRELVKAGALFQADFDLRGTKTSITFRDMVIKEIDKIQNEKD